jgi:predicted AlkP superfamily pyrophosphatase or phosphodiesterase
MLKRLKFLAVLSVLAFAIPLGAQDDDEKKPPQKPHGRVLLITFDGFRPESYQDARFTMPNLRALAARGVSAKKVVGIFPTLTYPSHTTIATGVRSARHGIVSNTIFDPKDGGKRWYFEAAQMRATPIWDAAKRAGFSTSAVRWPVTVGATTIDWHIAEIFGRGFGKDPWDTVRTNSTPGLFDELTPSPSDAKGEPAIDVISTQQTCGIIAKYKPELMLLHLLQTDGAQHHAGRDDPSVYAAFAKLDEHLGSILKALDAAGVGTATNVIVTGDHSMMDVHTAVKPNALLRELGFLKLDEKGKLAEWSACANTGGGSAGIYPRDPSDKATNDRIVAALKSAMTSRYRGMFQVLDREALDREEAFPGAICALEGESGFTMEADGKGEVLGPAHLKGNHGYLPSRDEVCTGLVMAGPGLVSGRMIPVFRQIDLAPLAAHLCGFDMGPGVEGVVVPGVLAPRGRTRQDDH